MHGHRSHYVLVVALSLLIVLLTATPGRAQDISTGDGAWVWQNPRPQGNTLKSVWGTDANNVWAVGEAGTVLKLQPPALPLGAGAAPAAVWILVLSPWTRPDR